MRFWDLMGVFGKSGGLAVLALGIVLGAADAQAQSLLFAGSGHEGMLFVYEVPSLKPVKEIQAGFDISDIVFSGSNAGNDNGKPDGKFAYVLDKAGDAIKVVDLSTLSVSRTIALPRPLGGIAMAITPDGKSVVVAGHLTGKVAKVDLATGKAEVVETKPQPSGPFGVAVTKDGKRAIVTLSLRHAVAVLSLAPFKVEKEVPVGFYPMGLSITPDDKFAIVSEKVSARAAFIDLGSLTVAKSAATVAGPVTTVVDSKGKFAYQTGYISDTVAKIDLEKKEMVEQFPVHFRPIYISITPDDKHLVVGNTFSTELFKKEGEKSEGNIQVLDAETGKTVKQVVFPMQPLGVRMIAKELVKAPLTEVKPMMHEAKVGPLDRTKPGIIERPGNVVEVHMKAFSYAFTPNEIRVPKGAKVKLIVTNIDERAGIIKNPDVTHGVMINGYEDKVNLEIPRGKSATAEFVADKVGSFDFYCSHVCGVMHQEMRGKFIVE